MGQVGHTARVCGVVASAVYQANSSAHPTGINRSDLWDGSGEVRRHSRSDAARNAHVRDRVRQLLPPKARDDPEHTETGVLLCPAQLSRITIRRSA